MAKRIVVCECKQYKDYPALKEAQGDKCECAINKVTRGGVQMGRKFKATAIVRGIK